MVAGNERAERQVRQPVGQFVQIEQQFFRCGRRPFLSQVDRILLSTNRSREIEIVAAPIRSGVVVFLDVADDLVVEGLFPRVVS